MVVCVLPGGPEATVGADAAERLAELGISRVTMLRAGHDVAVVLEGWAFDAERSTRDALAVLGAGSWRAFHQVAETSVSRSVAR